MAEVVEARRKQASLSFAELFLAGPEGWAIR
jgi:hypothetical protein